MSSSSNPFSISFPEGWEDQTIYTFKGPEDSGVHHMLTLVIDRSAGDAELSEYARERIENTMNTLQGAEILKDEEKSLSNGDRIYECVYKWIPSEDNVIIQKQVFAIKNGNGYTFTSNFSKKTIKTIGVEVDRIISSILSGGEN